MMDAGAEEWRAKIRRAGGISWPSEYQPGRQDGVDGIFPGCHQSRHQRRRRPETHRKAYIQPSFVAVGAPSLHTVLPLWERNLLYVNSEAIAERCNEALNFAGLIDNRNSAQPRLMSLTKKRPLQKFLRKGRPVRTA